MSRAGGSMGGNDPRKYGPVRSLIAHYAKMPHPFRTCVRDNRKRFGTRTEALCAWIKDQARGTTYWRGKEGGFTQSLREEGFSEAAIQILVFSGAGEDTDPPTHEEGAYLANRAGVDYDEYGFDGPCPLCGSYAPCTCDNDWDGLFREAASKRMLDKLKGSRSHLVEAPATNSPNFQPGPALTNARTTANQQLAQPGGEGDLRALDTLRKESQIYSAQLGSDDAPDPREVARAENGTIVYDDGSIKNEATGITKYPVVVYPDGSVRYDDGSVAKPGSLGALMVTGQMTREDRAKLFAAGTAGLPMSEFASVRALIQSAVEQTFSDTGAGGAGELLPDQVAQQQAIMQGLGPADVASLATGASVPAGGDTTSPGPGRGDRGGGRSADKNAPIKLERGEKVVRGPDGGRGVWRQIDGNAIFIKLGQTPAQAKQEAKTRPKGRGNR